MRNIGGQRYGSFLFFDALGGSALPMQLLSAANGGCLGASICIAARHSRFLNKLARNFCPHLDSVMPFG